MLAEIQFILGERMGSFKILLVQFMGTMTISNFASICTIQIANLKVQP